MNKYKLEIILLIFIFALGTFLVIKPSFTSYATFETIDPILNLELNKNTYDENELIRGNISINFQGPIETESDIIILFNDKEYKEDMRQILYRLGKTFTSTVDSTVTKNPSTTKSITFNEAGKKPLAFKLPVGSSINDIDLRLSSTPVDGINPTSVSLDFGDDNTTEWLYLGDFLTLQQNSVLSPTLDPSITPASTIIDDNKTYHCSLLPLPYSKDFEISVNYKLSNSTSTGGDIKAAIVSSLTSSTFSEEVCDLPEPNNDFAFKSCDIQVSNPIEADFLVCVFNSNPSGAYKIASDFGSSQNTFKCNKNINQFACDQINFLDYFIKIKGANYKSQFTAPINIASQVNDTKPLSDSLTNLLTNCKILDGNSCIIPISISSSTKGIVTLDQLDILLGSTEYNLFHDLETSLSSIQEINNIVVKETNITFPLSYFNLTLGDKSTNITVSLRNAKISKNIKLFNANVEDVNSFIDRLEKELNSIKENEFLITFKYNNNVQNALQKIALFKTQLSNVSGVSSQELTDKKLEIKTELDSLKNELPVDISEISKVRDINIIDIRDLDDIVNSGDKNSVLKLQDTLDIEIEGSLVRLLKYDGEEIKKTKIKKIISSREAINDFYVYERIPKNIADNINKITFEDNIEIIEEDPIFRKRFDKIGKEKTIEIQYFIEGDILNKIDNTKTFLVPSDVELGPDVQVKQQHVCGDDICSIPFEDSIICPQDCKTQRNILPWIIGGLILIILGIGYFNFYKGKWDFRKLTKGKNPFKNEQQLKSVKKFINDSLDKKIDKKNLIQTLLHKGWSKKEVRYAFDEVEWEKRRVLIKLETPPKTAKIKSLKKYVKKCRKYKISDEEIKRRLMMKGWKKTDVEKFISKPQSLFSRLVFS